MYLSAMRLASSATQKQSPGVLAAITGTGASELRPKSAWKRSACSVLVGRPVDGPPRWMSTITSGSSTIVARPIASPLSAMPGPEVVVIASEPAYDGADRRGDRGDLVLGLERDHAELLVHRELVQDVRRRRDRVAALEETQPRLLRRHHEAHRERGVAREVAVDAGRELRGRDLVGDLERLGRVAVRVAGLHRELVGLGQHRLRPELLVEPAVRRVQRAVVEPVAHAEREEVLAPVHALGVEPEVLERRARELGELDREQPIALERAVLERAHRHLRLLEVGLLEVVDVDDQDPALLQVGQVHLERRRVHRDQHVDRVAGREDVLRPEVDLEPAHAGQRARGGADLGREVREGGEVVAEERRGVGELAAGDLHPVAGVPGEADHGAVERFLAARRCCGRLCGHAPRLCGGMGGLAPHCTQYSAGGARRSSSPRATGTGWRRPPGRPARPWPSSVSPRRTTRVSRYAPVAVSGSLRTSIVASSRFTIQYSGIPVRA